MSETLHSARLPAATLDGTENLVVLSGPPNGVLRKTTTQAIADLYPIATVVDGLPSAGALSGGEKVLVVDGGVAYATTVADIANAAGVAGVNVTYSGEVADKRILTITLTNWYGLAGVWIELVSAADASYALSDEGVGSIVFDNTTTKRTLVYVDATGTAEIGVTDTAAETISLAIGSGPGTKAMVGAVVDLEFT